MRFACFALVVAACHPRPPATPAPADADALIAAEQELFSAIAAGDRARLGSLVAEDLVLRTPGHDLTKADLLSGLAMLAGKHATITGEGLAATPLGADHGLVSGVEIVHSDDGDDREDFVDAFERRDGRWILVFAYSAPEP